MRRANAADSSAERKSRKVQTPRRPSCMMRLLRAPSSSAAPARRVATAKQQRVGNGSVGHSFAAAASCRVQRDVICSEQSERPTQKTPDRFTVPSYVAVVGLVLRLADASKLTS